MRLIRIPRPSWFNDAACRNPAAPDPAPFFPARGRSVLSAKATCNRCPVRQRCLDHALADASLEGVWGGTTETERDALRARRRAG